MKSCISRDSFSCIPVAAPDFSISDKREKFRRVLVRPAGTTGVLVSGNAVEVVLVAGVPSGNGMFGVEVR